MARLLLVGTDPYMRNTLEKLFAPDEYCCTAVPAGDEASLALQRHPFDLVILDVGQLWSEGLDLVRHLRTAHDTPILLLAPRRDIMDVVLGLQAGADDYLCEPFDARELVARVQAQLRRAATHQKRAQATAELDLGGMVLDVERREAFRNGAPLHLTNREFELLYLLARHRGKPVATERILDTVWDGRKDIGVKTLTVYVGRLRRKIEEDPADPQVLRSIRGFGYQLTPGTP